ncbi:MAG: hydrogenase maturation nickel metallochaperone HypA [Gemmataceae bacterium]
MSIAQSLIEMACETATKNNATRITKLFLRIGRLSGVVEEALRFSFDIAAEGTPCEGAVVEIEDVVVSVMCPVCDEPKTLADSYYLLCPKCQTPTPQILTGQEMELVSLEVVDHATPCS